MANPWFDRNAGPDIFVNDNGNCRMGSMYRPIVDVHERRVDYLNPQGMRIGGISDLKPEEVRVLDIKHRFGS